MFNNNRHLNIFEHYTQKGSLPIENNLSRGLAILLNENHLFLDRFLDMINEKCISNKTSCRVLKPQKLEEKEIGIQQQIAKIATDFPNPKNVIGITLTTKVHVEIVENKISANNNLITDIVVICKDTLIVIEVKRNATDAREQLKQQVNSIITEVVRCGGDLPEKTLLDGTWEEVISLLQDIYAITGHNTESILGHYIKHLEYNYQEWFPVSLLTDLEIKRDNCSAIDKRIHKLIKNCCENEDDEKKYSGRYIIPLNYDFTTEAQVSMDYDKKGLKVTIWSGDTKWQGYCLLNKTAHDFSWIYDNQMVVEEQILEVSTKPYLRLAHFQTSIVIEYFMMEYYRNRFGSSKDMCVKLFEDISGEWKRKDWSELISILSTRYEGLIDLDSFRSAFGTSFEDSNRSYTHVSFGYETSVFLPLDVIKAYERGSDKRSDYLAKYVMTIISDLIAKIV